MDLRKLIAVAAVLTCAAASGVALGRRTPDSGATVAITDPPPFAPAPALTPAPSEAPVTPSPPIPAPDPTWTSKPPLPPPAPPPVVVPVTPVPTTSPAGPLPTSWRAENGGATLDVRVSRATVPTAKLVDFDIELDAGAWFVHDVHVGWGDGTGHQVTDVPINPCGPESHQIHRHDTTLRHAYRAPGPHAFEIRFSAAPASTCETFEHVMVVVKGTILVTPGPTPGNGPWPVTVDFANQLGITSTPPGHVDFQGSATDLDGWVGEVSVDWGDGSPPAVTTYPLEHCDEDGRRWPRVEGAHTPFLTHEYAEPGRYTVTFRAVSTGCDGGDRQEVSVQVPVDG